MKRINKNLVGAGAFMLFSGFGFFGNAHKGMQSLVQPNTSQSPNVCYTFPESEDNIMNDNALVVLR